MKSYEIGEDVFAIVRVKADQEVVEAMGAAEGTNLEMDTVIKTSIKNRLEQDDRIAYELSNHEGSVSGKQIFMDPNAAKKFVVDSTKSEKVRKVMTKKMEALQFT